MHIDPSEMVLRPRSLAHFASEASCSKVPPSHDDGNVDVYRRSSYSSGTCSTSGITSTFDDGLTTSETNNAGFTS